MSEGAELGVEQIQTMFAYSMWARDRVLGAARTLDDAAWRGGEHKGGYGSIHDTLAHMAVSEWLWLRRCLGQSPLDLPKGESFPTIEALVEWWDIVHGEAMSYLSTLSDAELTREITYTAPDGKSRTRRVWHMLLQVSNHQTEHRAQIGTMLGQMGVQAPPTDLVVYLSGNT